MPFQPANDSVTIRRAVSSDISRLAALHVITWNATYPNELQKPTFAIREWQWKDAFKHDDGSWFCYVAENQQHELVGFAKGKRDKNGHGDLNKIYLLDEYKGRGLGKQLVICVAHDFIKMGINFMFVVADAQNASCGFYEHIGGKRKHTADKGIAVYTWHDLQSLVQ